MANVTKLHLGVAGKPVLVATVNDAAKTVSIEPQGGPGILWWRQLLSGKAITLRIEEVPDQPVPPSE